jgi:hypothetical protein
MSRRRNNPRREVEWDALPLMWDDAAGAAFGLSGPHLAIALASDMRNRTVDEREALEALLFLEARYKGDTFVRIARGVFEAQSTLTRLAGTLGPGAKAATFRTTRPGTDAKVMVHPTSRPDAEGRLQITYFVRLSDGEYVPSGHHYATHGATLMDAVREAWQDYGPFDLDERANPPDPPAWVQFDDPGTKALWIGGDLHDGTITVEEAMAAIPGLKAEVTEPYQLQEIAELEEGIEKALRLRDVLAQLRGAKQVKLDGRYLDYVVHRTPRPDAMGKLQVTRFTKDGTPEGHQYYSGDLAAVVRQLWNEERGQLALAERANPPRRNEPWEPEEYVPAFVAPPPPRRAPLPPELRPKRDPKQQAKYEKRMARKDKAQDARWHQDAAAFMRTIPHREPIGPDGDDLDDLDELELGDPGDGPAERCPFCGRRAWVDLTEYWPHERRFTIDSCCEGSYEWWVREMREWTPAEWQAFMLDKGGIDVRTVGGRPELRESLGVREEDVFLADEPLSVVRSVSMEQRRNGQVAPGALTIDEVREYVRLYHKHAGNPPAGAVWGYAVYNGMPGEIAYNGDPAFSSRKDGRRPLNIARWPANLIGVVMIGRPASRLTQQRGEALTRVAAGEAIEDVAADLAIKPKTIATWVASGEKPGERVAEVSRVALNHDLPSFVTYKASSLIYDQAAKDAKAAGFTKIQTFTLESESGMSLRYARWKPVASGVGGGQFTRKGRTRHVREGELAKPKTRWERSVANPGTRWTRWERRL